MKRENSKIENCQSGQSLVEVIVAIGIAAIFLGAGVAAIAPIIRSNLESRTIQFADSLAQDYSNKLQNLAESNWTSLYSLSKGSGNYMLIASGTQTLVVEGQESSPDGDIVSGLVGHWKFDEAAGMHAYDFSGNGNGGTLINGPTRTASSSCAAGSCLNFNGSNNYLTTINSNNLNFSGSFSISAWVKPSLKKNQRVVYKWNNKGYWLTLNELGTIGGVEYGATVKQINGNTILADNEWANIAFIRNANNNDLKLYVNGTEDATPITSDGGDLSNTDNLFVGIDKFNANAFNGLIDDVRVYNRALSAAEVKQLYSSRVYLRSFTIDNVSRDSCGVGSVSTEATSTCSTGPGTTGVADDPSTQKITINVNWSGGGSAGSALSKIQYIARAASAIFNQTDWSGGAGQEGPLTAINNKFASSTGISFLSTPGSIAVSSISEPAPVVSSIDPNTGDNSGSVSLTSITGSNFTATPSVKLMKSGESDIACTGVSFSDSSTLTGGSCDITGATVGNWSVVVTNPDSQSGSLSEGFAVTGSYPSDGLFLHLDADSITGLNDGASIAQWNDISGTGNHLAQSEESVKPTYETGVLAGNPVVRFSNGQRLVLDNALTSDLNTNNASTIFAVYTISVSGNDGLFEIGADASGVNQGISIIPWSGTMYSRVVAQASNDITWAYSVPYTLLATQRYSGAATTHEAWANGILQNSRTIGATFTNTLDSIVVGDLNLGSYALSGDIAEMMFYDRALTDEEKQQVEQYLGAKWLGW
jgi:type II secretory pathway pseudopilin PulG